MPTDTRDRKAYFAAYRNKNRKRRQENDRKRYTAKREEILKKQVQYKRDNHEKVRAGDRARYPEVGKNRDLRKTFGITLQTYNGMLDAQGFVCAICEAPELARGKRLAVDHCHKTGKIRGLLCRDCNLGLGWFSDDVERLKRAAQFLREMQQHPK